MKKLLAILPLLALAGLPLQGATAVSDVLVLDTQDHSSPVALPPDRPIAYSSAWIEGPERSCLVTAESDTTMEQTLLDCPGDGISGSFVWDHSELNPIEYPRDEVYVLRHISKSAGVTVETLTAQVWLTPEPALAGLCALACLALARRLRRRGTNGLL